MDIDNAYRPCAHLQTICIAQVNLDQLKVDVDDHGKRIRKDSIRTGDEDSEPFWNCVTCGGGTSPWMCLSCGLVHCGRNENKDALRHYALYPNHCISMGCIDTEVFCYACDNYVGEDTDDNKIQSVRKSIQAHIRARKYDHAYSKHSQIESSCEECETENEFPVEEGTEEEEDLPYTNTTQSSMSPKSPIIFVTDEDSGSVPEEEMSSLTLPIPHIPAVSPAQVQVSHTLIHLSNSAPQLGNLAQSMVRGGHLLRARKRKVLPEADSPSSSVTVSLDGSSGVPEKRRGLVNLGNTCFMNSVVQALASLDMFREFMCSLPILETDSVELSGDVRRPRYNTRRAAAPQNEQNSKPPQSSLFAEELRKTLIEIMSSGKVQAFSPDSFFDAVWKLNPRFRGFQQQDAHEFLRSMLDKVHVDLRKCRIPEDADRRLAADCGNANIGAAESAISRLFEGALQSQVTCLTCSSASSIQDPFLDLSLELVLNSSNRAGNIPLTDCIRHFFAKEELDHCEQYMCARCGERRPSTKQLFIKTLPNVLCLHLKRFRWVTHRGKLDFMVDFPLTELDMSAYMTPSMIPPTSTSTFDLSSIIVHQGSGVSSGHYIAYGLHRGSWWQYNDDRVKATNEIAVLKQKAYLLFYTRKHVA